MLQSIYHVLFYEGSLEARSGLFFVGDHVRMK